MKTKLQPLVIVLLSLSLVSSFAQPGGMGGGQNADIFKAGLKKVLGDNKAFSAAIEIETPTPGGKPVKMPGKIAYDDGKSRLEMDMSKANMPEAMLAQMKAMGMDSMVIVSLPENKSAYMIYPGLKAYAEEKTPETESAADLDTYKVESTELGKENVEGQPCVKNKVVITDSKSKSAEYTIWQATSLKKFPVKIETKERGQLVTMTFKDVKLSRPDASQFSAPKDFKRYENLMALMQEQMMKAMGGAAVPGGR
jgi:hypothetical protein